MSLKKILNQELLSIGDFELEVSNIIIIVAIIVAARLLLTVSKKLIDKQLVKKRKVDPGRSAAFYQVMRYIIFIVSIVLLLESMGVSVTILMAGSAALLVGLGFGIQQIFNDLVSGIILLFEGTVSVGDVVEVESLVGKVLAIRLRTSIIESREKNNVIVPNSKLVSDNVINWSYNREASNFKIEIGVAYGSDLDKVKSLLETAVSSHPDVLKDPFPIVRFMNFGESSLDFDILFYTNNMMQIDFIKSDIRFAINRTFREHNISIPFPQRDVHVFNE